MCNLSQGVLERGIERGIEQGYDRARKDMVISLLKEGLPTEQIARVAKLSINAVKAIIEEALCLV